ncbi:hypothetical protein M422DRAFT_243683 [Sphaerobolus stellatus SS14]|nr:hypothetical protein M422DRAFT_243683 [Sphaerobolus stellatus SS14]
MDIKVTIKHATGLTPKTSKQDFLSKKTPMFYVIVSCGKVKKPKMKSSAWKDGLVEWDEDYLFTGLCKESVLRFDVYEVHAVKDICCMTVERAIGDNTLSDEGLGLHLQPTDDDDKSLKDTKAVLVVSITSVGDTYKATAASVRIAVGKVPETSEGVVTEGVDMLASTLSEGPAKIGDALDTWEPVLDKIDAFVTWTEKISEVHPYAKIASTLLLAAYNIWKAQRDRYKAISQLLEDMSSHCEFVQRARSIEEIASQKVILEKFMAQIRECSDFIQEYATRRNSGEFIILSL